MSKELKKFESEQEACDWMYNEAIAGEDCIDNYRFAFQEDSEAMNKYEDIKTDGCCGSFDEEIIVAGRLATIGCNFGH